jgi:hypothetical protein
MEDEEEEEEEERVERGEELPQLHKVLTEGRQYVKRNAK